MRRPVVISKLADYTLQPYAAKNYLAAHPSIRTARDLEGHSFISYVGDLLLRTEQQLLHE